MSVINVFASLSLVSIMKIERMNGHSWLHCSDYDGVITGQDFDEDKCNGYIRSWSDTWGATSFATDRGINYFGVENGWCQSSFSSDIESMYDSGYGPATWNIGDNVTLVWPAKNHANYECFANIPDTSMKLYYNSNVNPDSDPSGAVSGDEWDLLIDFQDGCEAGTDGCGFQQCPDFCDNTDGAPCFGEYTVTKDDFPDEGYYTIMWYWIFNPGAPYTTCFEVYVQGSGISTNTDTDDDTTDDGDDTTTDDDDTTTTDDDTITTDDDTITTDDDTITTEDDTITTEDDDTPTDDGDSDDSSSGSSDYIYIVTVPICYYGGDSNYDEDTLIDGANGAFDGTTTQVDWSVIYEMNGNNGFNVTIQTHADDPSTVNSVSYSYATSDSQLCQAIEDEFNDNGICTICDPGAMATYTLSDSSGNGNNNNNNSSNDDDEYGIELTIGVIVAGVVILCLVVFCVYRSKFDGQADKSMGTTEKAMADHVPQNSHHIERVTTAEDEQSNYI